MNRKLFITILIALSSYAYTNAQITIGSLNEPVKGAILQIDGGIRDGSSLVNSNKGVMLPRVELASKNDLYPMYLKDYPDMTEEEVKAAKKGHAGLMVYNTEVFGQNECPGVYSWTGEEWLLLNQPKPVEGVQTFTALDGNTYRYKRYGDMYWMIDNLRSLTTDSDGVTPLPTTDKDKEIPTSKQRSAIINLGREPATLHSTASPLRTDRATLYVLNKEEIAEYQDTYAKWNLPKSTTFYIMNEDTIKLSLDDFVTEFGLLYTSNQTVFNNICPKFADQSQNWRTPTTAEWKQLVVDIMETATGNTHTWDSAKDDVGPYMKNDRSSYKIVGSDGDPNDWTGADPCDADPKVNSHFNAKPIGLASGSASLGTNFGKTAGWWANDETFTDGFARYRFDNNSDALTESKGRLSTSGSQYLSKQNGYSLRCVRPAN